MNWTASLGQKIITRPSRTIHRLWDLEIQALYDTVLIAACDLADTGFESCNTDKNVVSLRSPGQFASVSYLWFCVAWTFSRFVYRDLFPRKHS